MGVDIASTHERPLCVLLLQFQSARKQNVVFKVYVLVEIAFQVFHCAIKRAVRGAGVRGWLIIIRNLTQHAEFVTCLAMVLHHPPNRLLRGGECIFPQRPVAPIQLFNVRKQNALFTGKVMRQLNADPCEYATY